MFPKLALSVLVSAATLGGSFLLDRLEARAKDRVRDVVQDRVPWLLERQVTNVTFESKCDVDACRAYDDGVRMAPGCHVGHGRIWDLSKESFWDRGPIRRFLSRPWRGPARCRR